MTHGLHAGHVHAYERTAPVNNYSVDPCGTVHITIGVCPAALCCFDPWEPVSLQVAPRYRGLTHRHISGMCTVQQLVSSHLPLLRYLAKGQVSWAMCATAANSPKEWQSMRSWPGRCEPLQVAQEEDCGLISVCLGCAGCRQLRGHILPGQLPGSHAP